MSAVVNSSVRQTLLLGPAFGRTAASQRTGAKRQLRSTRNDGKCRSNVRNMSSISRRIDLYGSDIRFWLLDHKLGNFIGALHRSPNCHKDHFVFSTNPM